MQVLIEGYKYKATDVRQTLEGITRLENIKEEVVVNYVGYFFNPSLNDCVFILPKVLMNEDGYVFGKYKASDLIDFKKNDEVSDIHRRFIYEFAVWIYRTIAVFNKQHCENDIVYHKIIPQIGGGKKKQSDTFLDILLSLIRFHKENQDFIMFTLKNLHSGFNKINWTRTISHSSAIIQNDVPLYLNPVNKKRQINFDEELMIIYFSILQYIHDTYGFSINTIIGFQLIKGKQFDHYIKGFGKRRLLQIKYKYFSDKALQIWNLCYAFFDNAYAITVNTTQQEYLLVKNFNIVFEAIIDDLIGEKRENLPNGLKDQDDGKIVDHMYRYQDLISTDKDKEIYYIGDSKYYKLGNDLGKLSIYKQYTYARNVIQWNLSLFLDGKNTKGDVPKYRDDVTEGYNIVPNFFISANMRDDLSYSDDIEIKNDGDKTTISRQFQNRLFDRDTLLISRYDVNFLFIILLYARENLYQKALWKEKVRKMFRTEIQNVLKNKFDFYAMQARPGVEARQYIQTHFQQTLGKIYQPFDNDKYYSLALDKADPEKDNNSTLSELQRYFIVEKCDIGQNPEPILAPQYATAPTVRDFKNGFIEEEDDSFVFVGYTPKSSIDIKAFLSHSATTYHTGKKMPELNVDFSKIKYLMTNVANNGVYRIKTTALDTKDGTIRLFFTLGEFIQWEDKCFNFNFDIIPSKGKFVSLNDAKLLIKQSNI